MITSPAIDPSQNVIEVEAPVDGCILKGCSGMVVRHSLGGAQAVYRCTRCFRRYQVRSNVAIEDPPAPGRLRRLLNDFTSWRDD